MYIITIIMQEDRQY